MEASTNVSRYLREIGRQPPLSREQEHLLARQAQDGHDAARNRLVEANLGFVVRVAKEYRGLGIPFEDLLNEGNLGLIEAASRFDAAKGTKFITCAIWWIRKAILKALDEQSSLVRLPNYQRRKLREAQELQRSSQSVRARRPYRLRTSCNGTRRGASISVSPRGVRTFSLDSPSGAGWPNGTLAERLDDQEQISPERELLSEEAHRLVGEAVTRLPDNERQVIVGRFGLAGDRPLVLKELGEEMGLSRERVRQLEQRAIGRLRRILAHRAILERGRHLTVRAAAFPTTAGANCS
jgi:RNA polymerase primary sigma factor